MRAILDLREAGKFISQMPRHPAMDADDYPPAILSWPNSVGVFQIILRAEAFVRENKSVTDGDGERLAAANRSGTSTGAVLWYPSVVDEGNQACREVIGGISRCAAAPLPHEITYIEKCFIARGCHKAIRIRHALGRWLQHLKEALERSTACLNQFKETSELHYELSSPTCPVDHGHQIKHEMYCRMHASMLEGVVPVLRFGIAAAEIMLAAPQERMFSAGDNEFRCSVGMWSCTVLANAMFLKLAAYRAL